MGARNASVPTRCSQSHNIESTGPSSVVRLSAGVGSMPIVLPKALTSLIMSDVFLNRPELSVSMGRSVAQDEKNRRAEMVTLIPGLALSKTCCLNLNPTPRDVEMKRLVTSRTVSKATLDAGSDRLRRAIHQLPYSCSVLMSTPLRIEKQVFFVAHS